MKNIISTKQENLWNALKAAKPHRPTYYRVLPDTCGIFMQGTQEKHGLISPDTPDSAMKVVVVTAMGNQTDGIRERLHTSALQDFETVAYYDEGQKVTKVVVNPVSIKGIPFADPARILETL